MNRFSQLSWEYGIAIAATLTALGLMLVLDPLIHLTQASFLLFFGAVTVSALYAGQGPGILSTLLSALFANHYFLEPRYSWTLHSASGARMLLFVLEGLLISVLVGSLRISQVQIRKSFKQLQDTEAEINTLNQTLQRRVDELQTLFNVIPIAIAIAEDPECRVIKVNPAFTRLLQVAADANTSITPGADQPQPPFKIYQNGRELTGDRLPQQYAAKHGVELRDLEIDVVRKDGSVSNLYGYAAPLFDESGQSRGSVGTFVDITERKRIETALHKLVECSGVTGSEFFETLVRTLAELFQVRYVYVAELLPENLSRVRTIAAWVDGQPGENVEYDLMNTPCEQVVRQQTCFYPRNVANLFPQDEFLMQAGIESYMGTRLRALDGKTLGLLTILHDRPLDDSLNPEALLEIFAGRTAAELERERAIAALRHSEERYRAFITHSTEGVWRFELEEPLDINAAESAQIEHMFRYAYLAECNQVMAEMYGFSSVEEILGARLGDLVLQSDPHNVEYLLAFIHSDYRLRDAESYELDAFGNPLYFANSLVGIIEDGFLVRAWGNQRSITDRKQVEAERRQAEQEREQLLAREQIARIEAESAREQIFGILGSITDGFIAFDRQWRFTYLNQEGSRTLGRSPEELLGKNVWAEFPELANTEFGQLYQRAVAEGSPLELEGYYAPFDTWFSVRAYPSSVGLSLYFRNINDRKQAEAEIAVLNRDLQNRINELQTLFEVIPIGILITDDLTFKQIRSNPSFAQVLGLAVDNASWTPPPDTPQPAYKIFSHGKELTPEETPLRRAALEGIEIKGAEVDILRGDGALFNLYGYASPLFDEQGRVRGAVGAFLDITDRKRSEAEREQLLEREQAAREQAEAANRIKDEFLAVLSHELRTPLNPILGWTKLLRAGKLNAQKTAMALETIERNAKLQTQLIEDLLDVSRILRGKLSLNMAPVDLPLTIEAALETVRLAAEAKAIHIHMVLNPIAGQVLGDAARLQQVVWNLLSNAVKFTPEGGRIDIRLEQVDDGDREESPASPSSPSPTSSCAQITVIDTGKGISPEFLPYIFEYFRQADATTTRQFGGLGLGLAIVRQLVELHGGTVQANSPGENQGTTFIVKLPLLKEQRERINSEIDSLYPASPILHPLQGIRVLIVDDEADARDLVTFVLEEAGAIPTVATCAIEALDLFPQVNPDVVVSDIGMPEMDGYELIQRIRIMPSEQNGQVPAIALTAYAGEKNQQHSLDSGFQYHLTKPVEPNELIGVILSLLKKTKQTLNQVNAAEP